VEGTYRLSQTTRHHVSS